MKNKFLLMPLIILSIAWIIWGVAFLVYGSVMGNAALLIGSLIGIGSIPWADSKCSEGDIVIFKLSNGLKKFLRENVFVFAFFCVVLLFSTLAYQGYGAWAGALAGCVGCGIAAFAIIMFFIDCKEESVRVVAGKPDNEIMISLCRGEILKKILRSKVVRLGLPLVTGFFGTHVLMHHGVLLGILVILAGIVVTLAVYFTDFIHFSEKEKMEDRLASGPVSEIVVPQKSDGALEYLATAYSAAPNHCISSHIDSIIKRATRLLSYRSDDGTVGEIIATYHVFIEQYVARAAELVRKYWKAFVYLSSVDLGELSSEISRLQTEIESGDASAKKTLDEKKITKAAIEEMRKKQLSIGRGLGEIAATLEAMETIVISAETSDADAKDVRDELQRTLSTTTLAIKETLCDHEK
ncbi:MAG: hypothetical protein WC848_02865 [Parcubacteria group bacterium]|jgi:hypothetical protein